MAKKNSPYVSKDTSVINNAYAPVQRGSRTAVTRNKVQPGRSVSANDKYYRPASRKTVTPVTLENAGVTVADVQSAAAAVREAIAQVKHGVSVFTITATSDQVANAVTTQLDMARGRQEMDDTVESRIALVVKLEEPRTQEVDPLEAATETEAEAEVNTDITSVPEADKSQPEFETSAESADTDSEQELDDAESTEDQPQQDEDEDEEDDFFVSDQT